MLPPRFAGLRNTKFGHLLSLPIRQSEIERRRQTEVCRTFMDEVFVLQVSLEMGFGGGSECVAYELHGDWLVGDVCVVHAVNRASLAEKRRAGYYGWLFNPSNVWVTWRDWWMFGGGRYRRLVAVSERVRRQLKEYYHVPDERIVTIPNGINLSRFHPSNAESRAEVRRSFGLAQDVPLVLFVGNQYQLKGLEFAIRALAEMKTKAFLLVVGGDMSNPFKRLAEQLV